MESGTLRVRGARVHNLKDVDLELPKNRLICFTGVSGSGKSSMAFDTLYAEGQRRYVASLSAYARQFLGQMEKPDVDQITGLAPTISISQKSGGANPRSTVGTITEVYDYLRVLFARCSTPHCVECGGEIVAQTRDQIVARIAALPDGRRIQILASVVENRRGEYHDLFEELLRDGYLRARVDGQILNLNNPPELDRYSRHSIEVVIDRLVLSDNDGGSRARLDEAVDNALRLGGGSLIVADDQQEGGEKKEDDWLLSANFDCPACGISYIEPTPQMFSFNNPAGMCSDCDGLGTRVTMSERLIVPDPDKSIAEGAVEPLGEITSNRWRHHLYEGAAEHLGFALDKPWKELSDAQKTGFLYGLGDNKIEFTYTNQTGHSWAHDDHYEGALNFVEERLHHASAKVRQELNQYTRTETCPTCMGGRLRREALSSLLGGSNLPELTGLPIEASRQFFHGVELSAEKMIIAEDALKEIRGRLDLLDDIGLGYLTLDRGAHTLSGGESQRIRLASQIGSGLVGVLYILDEPSIGLHHRDNRRLLETLGRLRDVGNTVIVVEHDEATILHADLVVDFGPGAGDRGGHVVAFGSPGEIAASGSPTGRYISGEDRIALPAQRRDAADRWLTVRGARHNNLRSIDVRIPLGVFTCVTGVSGSGKSSLVNDILFKELDNRLHRAQTQPGEHDNIEGVDELDKVIRIDQRAIGRTPRSNPATYTDLFTPIRQLFTQLPESKVRGYKQGRFSFNVRGGRCEACDGNGAVLVEMEFLADVWVTCEACEGKRFDRETLSVKYREHSIADVLELEIDDALELFANIPQIAVVLQTLHDVGLGYIKLGQPAPTLSGGEAQRVKLSKELCRKSTGRTLYLLDEPTTGLHFADIERLLAILHRLADGGNTVVVIEHNTDVIKTADWILDIGPEGGAGGGLVVAEGSPEHVATIEASPTGQILGNVLAPPAAPPPIPGKFDDHGNGAIREIEIVGARMHNLKNVDVRIPRDAMTVISGVSGSGKSTLAFDTIYAEGQRRYVESLSAYARQFLDQMAKPKVERITGLSPAIAIEQKSPSKNPRSTVGTVTEVYDYVRALFATVGTQYCPRCNVPAGAQTVDQMVDRILAMPEGRRILLLAPFDPSRNEGYETQLRHARHDGFVRVRIDGEVRNLTEDLELDKRLRHRVELVVDRLVVSTKSRGRLAESVERVLELSAGEIVIAGADDTEEVRYSRRYSCPDCGRSFAPLVPQSFSFNHHNGMCQVCEGLGTGEGLDRDTLIPDRRLSVRQGAVEVWGPITKGSPFEKIVTITAAALGFDLDTPVGVMSTEARRALLYGAAGRSIELPDGSSLRYGGVLPTVDEVARHVPRYKSLLHEVDCSACEGSRLKSESRAVRLRESTVVDLQSQPISECLDFFDSLELDEREAAVAGELLTEVRNRLRFLDRVGLGYITLDRRAATLSGGEAQRIRLAGQIGSGLTGVLYLLDEPTIGLHPRDNRRLLAALEELRDLGNTVVVVEHDRDTLEGADYIVDIGPGAGLEGGHIVASGTPKELVATTDGGSGKKVSADQMASRTTAFLRGQLAIEIPSKRRQGTGEALVVRGARQNNLKHIDVSIPLGTFTCFTGVSGSGKSSLVEEILYTGLAAELHGASRTRGDCDAIEGTEHIDKVINIDQGPIGHSPRSTPATVMGLFDHVRQLYARLPDAKVRGFSSGRFSFNRAGGRCEACEGLGSRCIEMHFLPDVWVRCEACDGRRYNSDVLGIKFRGYSVSEVLDMTVTAALRVFANVTAIHDRLRVMDDVGLGYMTLGQSSTTLSGGEAQRLKLGAELAKPGTGSTLYIMDEPTTGLHFADIQKLLAVMQRLVEGGNSVVVVEHNLDVIKTADHLIDLGPEGGEEGGRIVAEGPPEKIVQVAASHTGRFLAKILPTAAKTKATRPARRRA
jgi:excinuclease ABC subunit A